MIGLQTIAQALPKHDRRTVAHRKALGYGDVAGASPRCKPRAPSPQADRPKGRPGGR